MRFVSVAKYVCVFLILGSPRNNFLNAQSGRGPASSVQASNWVGAWQASLTPGIGYETGTCPANAGLNGETVRNIVFLSAGGSEVRVRVSNAGGSAPIQVGSGSVAISSGGAQTQAGSLHPLTFSGQPATVVAAGSEALSDPVTLTVLPQQSLAVSLYFPSGTGPATIHSGPNQQNYLAAGNQAGGESGAPFLQTIECWMFLSGVDVLPSALTYGSLVALGDSITDGSDSTQNANHRYPDDLARRFSGLPGSALSVVNAGLNGNQLLAYRTGSDGPLFGAPAPARLARDVLMQAGVKAIILLEGINDIGASGAKAGDLIQIDQQIITQAHAFGVKIFGGTITPFGGSGAAFGGQYGTAVGEQQRQLLNVWILTSGAFDGVIDFDQAVRDPQNPTELLPAYDSGDHLHPNDAGYLAMADAVDINSILAATGHAGVSANLR